MTTRADLEADFSRLSEGVDKVLDEYGQMVAALRRCACKRHPDIRVCQSWAEMTDSVVETLGPINAAFLAACAARVLLARLGIEEG